MLRPPEALAASMARDGTATLLIDSQPQFFLSGQCYYRQIDHLSISYCSANVINDDDWNEYIWQGYVIAKRLGVHPTVGMAAFTGTIPSAVQRRVLASHMQKHDLPPLLRIAILTDSAVLRGAMTAFGWIMPRAWLRAFEIDDVAAAATWLRQAARFDEEAAVAAWKEARRKLGHDLPRVHRPSRGPMSGV